MSTELETDRRSALKSKIDALETRLSELERTLKAVLKGLQDYEEEEGEVIMPQGEYYGFKFVD